MKSKYCKSLYNYSKKPYCFNFSITPYIIQNKLGNVCIPIISFSKCKKDEYLHCSIDNKHGANFYILPDYIDTLNDYSIYIRKLMHGSFKVKSIGINTSYKGSIKKEKIYGKFI